MSTLKVARRTFIAAMAWMTLGLSLASVFDAPPAYASDGTYRVELLVGDRVDPTRKWGHVSLRVVGENQDLIYDFGRYGRMWNKDAEGDPIVRVWSNTFKQYMAEALSEGGKTSRFVFASNPARNAAIVARYNQLISKGKAYKKTSSWASYVVGGRAFHAVELNCTTMAIDSFMTGFPEFNLNVSSYAKARDLGFFLHGAAQGYGGYDQNTGRWARIWWPLDLRAVLQDYYVSKGLALTQSYSK